MSQLITKFIADNAVTGAKMRLNNNETKRARNAANTADIDLYKLTTANVLEFQTLPSALATLPIPNAPKQFATVEYIQNYLEGKTDVKNAAAYVLTTNLAGGTFNAGNATTPASITGTAQLVVDGKSFTGTDVNAATPVRIALVAQTAGLQNGIFDLTAASGTSYTLTRSPDFDGINNAGGQEITQGIWFRVALGSIFAGYEYQLTTPDPIVLNTTALTFVGYPSVLSITGGDMIVKNGNDFAVDLAPNGGLESTNPGNQAGQLRVKTASAALEKDRTIQLDATGIVTAKKAWTESFTLNSTNITNQYVDITRVAGDSSVELVYAGQGVQVEGVDFNVNYTGGANSKTRVSFIGGLGTAGASALAAGETIYIMYEAFGP